jgi:DNA-binding NarL/FixJ family response regulator
MRYNYGKSFESTITDSQAGTKLKVVLVDDSKIVRERIFDLVTEVSGVNVVGEAGNSIDAIECVKKLQPDVVILDIKMPGDSGVEVLKKIKLSHPSLIVIMLTNYPLPQYKEKCMEYGAEYFLNKSDEFEKLTDIIKSIQNKMEAGR